MLLEFQYLWSKIERIDTIPHFYKNVTEIDFEACRLCEPDYNNPAAHGSS